MLRTMSKGTVLVVDDEPEIREIIRFHLEREGFAVRAAPDGQQALDECRAAAPTLVVLDLMMPRMDGLELCRRLRGEARTRNLPILMLSAKGSEADIVLGLGLGADDYLSKPFSAGELVARVQAVLRRGQHAGAPPPDERVTRGALVVDIGRHEVLVDGKPVPFTAAQLRLLHYLAVNPGRVFTRDHLLERVVSPDAVVIDRNVDVHVRAIRQKLGNHASFIQTVRGVGYRSADSEGEGSAD